MQITADKQRTNIALTVENLTIARTEGNAAAISERRAWIEAHGMPLADLQVLRRG
tara:strand:- start:450 stop:614 length:165 start_codon:yes stop_codon:yes gene_type:complete